MQCHNIKPSTALLYHIATDVNGARRFLRREYGRIQTLAFVSSLIYFAKKRRSPLVNCWWWWWCWDARVTRELTVEKDGLPGLNFSKLQGSARSGSSNWIHLLARSGSGSWILRPSSLFKLCALYICMSVLFCSVKTKKLLDSSLRQLLYTFHKRDQDVPMKKTYYLPLQMACSWADRQDPSSAQWWNRDALELTWGKFELLGKFGSGFLLHKNWPFGLRKIFGYATQQPTLVWTNSAQMSHVAACLVVGWLQFVIFNIITNI